MKILSLQVRNFRSLKNVTWQPGDLNLVIGSNASGKSNLLQALELLSACADRGALPQYVRRAGGMEPLVWDGTAEGFSFSLTTTAPGSARTKRRFRYALDLIRVGSAFRIRHEGLDSELPGKGTALFFRRSGAEGVIFDGGNAPRLKVPPLPEDHTLLSIAGSPFAPSQLTGAFGEQLLRWSIYQDFRTDRAAPVRQSNLAQYETAVSPDGSNLVPVLHTLYNNSQRFQDEVDGAMGAAFGEDFDRLLFPPAADGRVQLRLRWKSRERPDTADQLSDGTLRFLFLIAALSNPSPPPLIAIDEPETGLHPRMLPIVAEHARDAADRSQVILTTHSAEFLDAFSQFEPTVSVTDLEGGATSLRVVAGEELDYWLRAYKLGQLYRSGTLEQMDPAA